MQFMNRVSMRQHKNSEGTSIRKEYYYCIAKNSNFEVIQLLRAKLLDHSLSDTSVGLFVSAQLFLEVFLPSSATVVFQTTPLYSYNSPLQLVNVGRSLDLLIHPYKEGITEGSYSMEIVLQIELSQVDWRIHLPKQTKQTSLDSTQ